jgi:hypothetical protein
MKYMHHGAHGKSPVRPGPRATVSALVASPFNEPATAATNADEANRAGRSTATVLTLALGIAAVCFALVASAHGVFAHSYPANESGVKPDDYYHTYCYTGSFTTDTSIGSDAMTHLGNITDMSVAFDSVCNIYTDVKFGEDGLEGYGHYECEDAIGNICTRALVELDIGAIDDDSSVNVWYTRRKVSIHEVGHSAGLGHSTSGATNPMYQGVSQVTTASAWRTYYGPTVWDNPHDIWHINEEY